MAIFWIIGFNLAIGQGQGQIDQKMVYDTLPFQDASLHQIWDSQSQLIQGYVTDRILLEMRSEVKINFTVEWTW